MANEVVEPDTPDGGRAEWIASLRLSSEGRRLDVMQEPDRAQFVRSVQGGFIVPRDFPVSTRERDGVSAMVIHIETEARVSASMLGELLIRIERGARRRVRRSDLDAFRVDVAELRTGSYFLKVVVPVAGLMFTFGGLLNDLYATFTKDKAAQRPAAVAITTIVLADGVQAVTLYSDDGLALRIDPHSAATYMKRHELRVALPTSTPESLPAEALGLLELPTSVGTKIAGSGRVFLVEGVPYVQIKGKEGAFVAIEDSRLEASGFVSGSEYNLVGTFDLDEDRFPRRFVLVDARRLQ